MKNPFINLGGGDFPQHFYHTFNYPTSCTKRYYIVATQNLVVSYKYLGDPAALAHDGTVYIYAGHNECPAPQQYYLMNECCISLPKT